LLKLKGRNDTDHIKQWNTGKNDFFDKTMFKKMSNIFHFLWSAMTIGGKEETKSEIISL
jgi:hypothetical protein